MGLGRWIIIAFFSAGMARAEPSDCNLNEFLQTIAAHLPSESKLDLDRLSNLTRSRIVDRAIQDHGSTYQRLYESIASYEKGAPLRFPMNHDDLYLKGSIQTSRSGALEVTIEAIKLPNLQYRQVTGNIDFTFYKTVGSILRGMGENVTRHPGQFTGIKLVGKTVVNKPLATLLEDIGFHPRGGVLGGILAQKRGLPNTLKGGVTITADALYSSHTAGMHGSMPLIALAPILTGSVKFATGFNDWGSLSAKGRTWTLEIPIAPALKPSP